MSGSASEFFDAERLAASLDEADAELGGGKPLMVVARRSLG